MIRNAIWKGFDAADKSEMIFDMDDEKGFRVQVDLKTVNKIMGKCIIPHTAVRLRFHGEKLVAIGHIIDDRWFAIDEPYNDKQAKPVQWYGPYHEPLSGGWSIFTEEPPNANPNTLVAEVRTEPDAHLIKHALEMKQLMDAFLDLLNETERPQKKDADPIIDRMREINDRINDACLGVSPSS